MPQIIVIRHAKSDWSSFNSDFERGLNERGYMSCEIISRELKKRINLPDKFLVSPAKRAQLTFEEIFFSWFQNKSIFQLTSSEEILYERASRRREFRPLMKDMDIKGLSLIHI